MAQAVKVLVSLSFFVQIVIDSTRIPALGSRDSCSLIQRLHRAGFRLGRQVRVPQRHLRVCVSQQFPDGVEVDAGHDQPAGEVVPYVVPPEALDARVLQ